MTKAEMLGCEVATTLLSIMVGMSVGALAFTIDGFDFGSGLIAAFSAIGMEVASVQVIDGKWSL
jgi:hypothetical protein